MLCITITHSRLPGWTSVGLFRLSEPVTTFIVPIIPIWKPVSSKLWISSSWTLYLAFVSTTSFNHALITSGSSWRTLWRSFARLNAIFSFSERVTNLLGQHLPTGPSPRIASSLLAISATSESRGANPRESRSRIYCSSVPSSVGVRFWRFGTIVARELVPVSLAESFWWWTLKATAALRWLRKWPDL
jgi:hypothetical protein